MCFGCSWDIGVGVDTDALLDVVREVDVDTGVGVNTDPFWI